MTSALISITLRALLNRRRTLMLALLAALLVLVAGVYRLGEPGPAEAATVTRGLLGDFGLGVLLPLVAVIVGISVLGSELDDGTIVYLLAKPVARSQILLVKLVAAWVVVSLLVVPAIIVAGVIGNGGVALAMGYGVAALVCGLEYTAIFVALSLITSRALIIGLAYVVIWEGVVAALFAGTRTMSVRQHALALAQAVGGDVAGSAELALGVALVIGAIVIVAATLIAIRRLETVELRGDTS